MRRLTHDEGVDVVVEAAGSARAVEEGLTLVRDGGRYVIAGHYADVGESSINAHQHINRKHLEIRGCWGSEPSHFLGALLLLERHVERVPWREWAAARTLSIISMKRSPTPRRCASQGARSAAGEAQPRSDKMRCTKSSRPSGRRARSPDVCEALIAAGVDVFRLNFSHGTHESHAETYRAIRNGRGDAAGTSPSCRT